MAIPKYDELFTPVLELLDDGVEHDIHDLIDPICNRFALTDGERQEMLSSQRQPTIVNRIGWARTYLKKAGLIASPKRGIAVITPAGHQAVMSGVTIDNAYLKSVSQEFRRFVSAGGKASDEGRQQPESEGMTPSSALADDITPDEALDRAMEQINGELADRLLEEIGKLDPIVFERFVLDLMKAMGYGAVHGSTRATPASNDEGIDGVIMEDRLGFNLIYVQVKHYGDGHVVGRPEIQSFVGAIAGRDGKGLFVTTSTFARPARDYARHQHIVLIDGHDLARLMIEHNFGVTKRKTYRVKALDLDLFDEYRDV